MRKGRSEVLTDRYLWKDRQEMTGDRQWDDWMIQRSDSILWVNLRHSPFVTSTPGGDIQEFDYAFAIFGQG
jgi:hypothetical protein